MRLVYERVKKVAFPRHRMRELFRKSVRIVIYQLNLLLMINKRCASDYLEVRAMEEFLGRDKDTARFNKEHYKRR